MADREQIRIFVSAKAKGIIKAFADDYDMTEQGVASRIYERFGLLPRPVQKWFIGLIEAGEGGGGLRMFADEIISAMERADQGSYGVIEGGKLSQHPMSPAPTEEPPSERPAKRRHKR